MESSVNFLDRLKHGWNAFKNQENQRSNANCNYPSYGLISTSRPDRTRLSVVSERSIVASIYTRVAIDVSAIDIKHVKLDGNGVYEKTIDSALNGCLTLEANIDQTGREFIFDTVISMFDEGCVALVPVDTSVNLLDNGSYDIHSLRVGKILDWYPRHVRVDAYNDKKGYKENLFLPKDKVAIVENPLYSVMNEPNSTLKRLTRKLSLLDIVDEESSSGKLDMIIQLPYVTRSETKQQQAENRRNQIADQLKDSQYGIAYIDASEKITQLNRSLDNNLLAQIEYLTSMLYSQLGITEDVFNGTANEATMLNYYNRTVEPVLSAICDEMKRKFLTKTARSQGHSIEFYRDPFRLVPVNQIAEIADKFTRNEILSGNEVRSIIGYKPSSDPRADELRNKNLNPSEEQSINPVLADTGRTEDVA